MQKLSVIALVLFASSCANKKTKIVEEIKLYKDSVSVVERNTIGLNLEDRKKYEEMFYVNGELDRGKSLDTKLKDLYNDYHAKVEDQKFQLKIKQADYLNKIDSLELELKKY